MPAVLRPLNTAHNLRWADFAVVKDAGGVTVGRRIFYPALWGLNPVTLCLALEQSVSSLHGKPPFSLNPLTELHDLVPIGFLPDADSEDSTLVQCNINLEFNFRKLNLNFRLNFCALPLPNRSNRQLLPINQPFPINRRIEKGDVLCPPPSHKRSKKPSSCRY